MKNIFKKFTKKKIIEIMVFVLFFLVIFGKDFFEMLEDITSDYRIILFSIGFALFVAFVFFLYAKFTPKNVRKDLDYSVGKTNLSYEEAKKSGVGKFIWYLRIFMTMAWVAIIAWILIKMYILN